MVNVIQQAIEALRGVIRVADRATVEFDAAKAALASLRAAQEGDLPPLPEKRTIRGNSPKGYAPRDMHNYARLALAAAGGGVPQEPARPDILERLSYHALERDDLTLDECLDYLAKGWAKVHGRTERQMVMQILALLASSPQPEAAHQPVRVGPFSIWNAGDHIAIYCDGGEGGEFNTEQFQKAVEAFYAASF